MPPLLQLPHTAGCLVCGRDNAHGLRLDLYVDPDGGRVSTEYLPGGQHIGFEGVLHGGVLATLLDEAMVWAATWSARRFCLCGELAVRFRQPARPGEALRVEAWVTTGRPRLILTEGRVVDAAGTVKATATAKYVPMDRAAHEAVLRSFVPAPETAAAADVLRGP